MTSAGGAIVAQFQFGFLSLLTMTLEAVLFEKRRDVCRKALLQLRHCRFSVRGKQSRRSAEDEDQVSREQ